MKPLTLSVLEFGNVSRNKTARQVLQETIYLASEVEQIGYNRIWLAENHVANVAWATPEIMVAIVAGSTSRIRVGTAATLLRFQSSYRLAETFRLLEALYPNRMDFGLGRASGSPVLLETILEQKSPSKEFAIEDFEGKIDRLIEFLADRISNSQITSPSPARVGMPTLWVMGSGRSSMRIASRRGLPFSYRLLNSNDKDDPSILDEYRSCFHPSPWCERPLHNIAVSGICARSRSKAAELLRACQPASSNDTIVRPTLFGTPIQCVETLLNIQQRFRNSEFIFSDLCGDFRHKLNSYTLLANAVKEALR